MIFSSLSREQVQHLLPKAQVAVALYRRHNALLSQQLIRDQIAAVDSDVALLLTLIYEKKHLTRPELITRTNREKQLIDQLQITITNPEMHTTTTSLQ
jgi:hypothetical protein